MLHVWKPSQISASNWLFCNFPVIKDVGGVLNINENTVARFVLLKAPLTKIRVFWNKTWCILNSYEVFGPVSVYRLTRGAPSTSETSVTPGVTFQAIWIFITGKAISIQCSEYVSAASVTQSTKHMCRIILSSVEYDTVRSGIKMAYSTLNSPIGGFYQMVART